MAMPPYLLVIFNFCQQAKEIFSGHICIFTAYTIYCGEVYATKGGMSMKKLLNGVFSSISDAELVMHNIKKENMQEEQPAATELPDPDDTPAE